MGERHLLLCLKLLMRLARILTHLGHHNQEEPGHCPRTWACGTSGLLCGESQVKCRLEVTLTGYGS